MWCGAEVYRIAGAIALMSPEPNPAKAEARFEQALSVARDQQARSFELRAATSMARLWHDQGRRRQARDLLAAVHGRFTAGFETGDLRQARVLLDGLAV
jgi:predicted ATPase